MDEHEDAGFERTGIKKKRSERVHHRVLQNKIRFKKCENSYSLRKSSVGSRANVRGILHGEFLQIKVVKDDLGVIADAARAYETAISSYIRHCNTNYDDIIRRIGKRGLTDYFIVIRLAVNEKIKQHWPELTRPCNLYAEQITKEFVESGGLKKTDYLRLNEDGTLHWKIWE